MCEQADGGDKTAVERRGKEKRYGDASGAAAEPGSGVSAVGKRKSECVCSPAPSASSRLFSECHSLHYQSKVCVCLCAHHLIALARALHAVESFHISSVFLCPYDSAFKCPPLTDVSYVLHT